MLTVNGVMTLDKVISDAEKLYKDAAIRMFKLIDAGMKIKKKAQMPRPDKEVILKNMKI